jgi:hypothetical protein
MPRKEAGLIALATKPSEQNKYIKESHRKIYK